MNTFHAVIDAAGRHDDECLPWIKEVETLKPEDLENPGDGWLCLDRKLASALMKIASGEMGKKMTLASSAAVSSGILDARPRALADDLPILLSRP